MPDCETGAGSASLSIGCLEESCLPEDATLKSPVSPFFFFFLEATKPQSSSDKLLAQAGDVVAVAVVPSSERFVFRVVLAAVLLLFRSSATEEIQGSSSVAKRAFRLESRDATVGSAASSSVSVSPKSGAIGGTGVLPGRRNTLSAAGYLNLTRGRGLDDWRDSRCRARFAQEGLRMFSSSVPSSSDSTIFSWSVSFSASSSICRARSLQSFLTC